jgi:hypothetical protein
MDADTPFDVLDTWEKKINVTDIDARTAAMELFEEGLLGVGPDTGHDTSEVVQRVTAILKQWLSSGPTVAIPGTAEELRAVAHVLLRRFRGVYDTGDLDEVIAILQGSQISFPDAISEVE